jgi:hypothetical protein
MGLETAKYITELDNSWPTPNDAISSGDDHLRLIKRVLQETFPEAGSPQAPIVYPSMEQGSVVHSVAGKWAETDGVRIDTEGNIQCANLNATGNVFSQSDERLKERRSTIDNALEKVKTIDTFTYLPNERGVECGMAATEQAGVSAQQVQAVFPQAVHQADNGYLAVDYARLCVLLLEAVKELSQEVESKA